MVQFLIEVAWFIGLFFIAFLMATTFQFCKRPGPTLEAIVELLKQSGYAIVGLAAITLALSLFYVLVVFMPPAVWLVIVISMLWNEIVRFLNQRKIDPLP